MDDLRIDITPDVTGATFQQIMNFFNDQIARRTGRIDFLTRGEKGDPRTATELELLAGERNARKRYKNNLFETFFKRVMTQAVDLNQQFLTFGKVIKIMGEEVLDKFSPDQLARVKKNGDAFFFTVLPEEISGRYDYIINTETSMISDKQILTQRLSQAISNLVDVLPVLQQQGLDVNILPLLKEYLEAIGIRYTDKLFVIKDENEQGNEGFIQPNPGVVEKTGLPSYQGIFNQGFDQMSPELGNLNG
jgi:hypothetical protein